MNILQVLSWVIALFLLCSYLVMVGAGVTMRESVGQKVLLVVLLVPYLLTAALMVWVVVQVTACDASDPTVAFEKSGSAQFDSSNYDYYCDLCETHVMAGSKHCRVCNRCSQHFDHHCRWVNNDIGYRNYRNFFSMLIAVQGFLAQQLVMSVLLMSWQWGHWLGWLALSSGVTGILFWLPIFYLFAFHCYI